MSFRVQGLGVVLGRTLKILHLFPFVVWFGSLISVRPLFFRNRVSLNRPGRRVGLGAVVDKP